MELLLSGGQLCVVQSTKFGCHWLADCHDVMLHPMCGGWEAAFCIEDVSKLLQQVGLLFR